MKVTLNRWHSTSRYSSVKETRVDMSVGNWPSGPGADGRVTGVGTWKNNPKPADAVWSVTLDESDDPSKADYRELARDVTYAEAKAILVARLHELHERRAALFTQEKG